MKKQLLLIGLSMMALYFTACKEVPVHIDMNEPGLVDTTYTTSSIETPQEKKYLVEELSGVKCVNCPAGMDMLTTLNREGAFKDKLVIASIHVGTFAEFIEGYSKQDFVVPGSEQLLNLILEADPGKPCAAFDRLRVRPSATSLLVDRYTLWPADLINARDTASTTPVNVHITTEKGDSDFEYLVTVTLHYTEAISNRQSLNIYLVENKIIDAMKYAVTTDTNYEFKHVLRRYITPPTGKQIMADVSVTPGRVYKYATKITIDPNDPAQSFWVPANMNVIAFVSSNEPYTKRVYQVQEVPLVP